MASFRQLSPEDKSIIIFIININNYTGECLLSVEDLLGGIPCSPRETTRFPNWTPLSGATYFNFKILRRIARLDALSTRPRIRPNLESGMCQIRTSESGRRSSPEPGAAASGPRNSCRHQGRGRSSFDEKSFMSIIRSTTEQRPDRGSRVLVPEALGRPGPREPGVHGLRHRDRGPPARRPAHPAAGPGDGQRRRYGQRRDPPRSDRTSSSWPIPVPASSASTRRSISGSSTVICRRRGEEDGPAGLVGRLRRRTGCTTR